MMTITYPNSRAHASNCKMCNMGSGQMQNAGYFLITAEDGAEHRLMKLTCFRCGYTIFFEPAVAKEYKYDGAHEERFPADESAKFLS